MTGLTENFLQTILARGDPSPASICGLAHRTAPHRTAKDRDASLLGLGASRPNEHRNGQKRIKTNSPNATPTPRDQFCPSLYPLHVILEGFPSHSCCNSCEHPLSPCNDRLHLTCCPVFYGNPSSAPLNLSISHQLTMSVVTMHRFIIHNSKLLSFSYVASRVASHRAEVVSVCFNLRVAYLRMLELLVPACDFSNQSIHCDQRN